MQVYSINNIGACQPRKPLASAVSQNASDMQVSFGERERRNGSHAIRNTAIALMMAGATMGGLSSCDDGYAYAHVEVTPGDSTGCGRGYLRDSTWIHDTDTIEKWYYQFIRPEPLDTVFNNLHNWGIDGTEGNMLDSLSKRNIVHYEGIRDWEYDTKEIADMNMIESNKKVLVYDIETLDYLDNHESYGKRIFRVPTGNFSIKLKDGRLLNNPKGLFLEEWRSTTDEKGGPIQDCEPVSRLFVTTRGDTLEVAKKAGTNEYVAKGKMARGYLNGGINTILLRDLIGQYSTDEHFLDFKVEAINDEDLRKRYVQAMDQQ